MSVDPARLAELVAAGWTNRQLAAEFDCGEANIARHMRRLGVVRYQRIDNRKSDQYVEALAALVTEGLPKAQIAARLGVNELTVAYWMVEQGLVEVYADAVTARHDARVAEIVARRRAGQTARQIAKDLHVSAADVSRHSRAAGIATQRPGASIKYPLLYDAAQLTESLSRMSAAGLARQLGCDPTLITRAIRRHGIDYQPPGRKRKRKRPPAISQRRTIIPRKAAA